MNPDSKGPYSRWKVYSSNADIDFMADSKGTDAAKTATPIRAIMVFTSDATLVLTPTNPIPGTTTQATPFVKGFSQDVQATKFTAAGSTNGVTFIAFW